MACDICNERQVKHNYVLEDGSSALLCDECATILYEKNIAHSIYKERLFQLIAMIDYVDHAKQKVLIK